MSLVIHVSRLSLSLSKASKALHSLSVVSEWFERKGLRQVVSILLIRGDTFHVKLSIFHVAPKPMGIYMVVFGSASEAVIRSQGECSIIVFKSDADDLWYLKTGTEIQML